ncbi:hypothetical protein M885DRAFT_123622 [Pelagophyceae sp. CCMP2097]|nr:hypothetical protein M885DRAFT_123622 [Pelagophyceae sp. CCMP2097]
MCDVRVVLGAAESAAFALADWPAPVFFGAAAAAAWLGAGLYAGDERRCTVQLKVASLLSLHAARGDEAHWLRRATGLQFYLAQAPLVAAAGDASQLAALLPRPAPAFLPPFVCGAVVRLNLWLGTSNAVSEPHFDDDHNVLSVVRGRKRVHLWPHRAGAARFAAAPPWSSSPNHCRPGVAAGVGPPPVMLRAGEALLIPAGYYHAVESDAGTIAVNAWWPPALATRADFARAVSCADHAYLARRLLVLLARRAVRRALRRAATTRLAGAPRPKFAEAPGEVLRPETFARARDVARARRLGAAATEAGGAAPVADEDRRGAPRDRDRLRGRGARAPGEKRRGDL